MFFWGRDPSLLVWQWIRFCSVKQYAKRMKLTSLMFDWYYIVLNFIQVFTLHSLHFQYQWFPFTIISPFIVSWHFWQKPVFGKMFFFSCKNSICWPIVVSITTNRLMLIGKSILNFLDFETERVLVKVLENLQILFIRIIMYSITTF